MACGTARRLPFGVKGSARPAATILPIGGAGYPGACGAYAVVAFFAGWPAASAVAITAQAGGDAWRKGC